MILFNCSVICYPLCVCVCVPRACVALHSVCLSMYLPSFLLCFFTCLKKQLHHSLSSLPCSSSSPSFTLMSLLFLHLSLTLFLTIFVPSITPFSSYSTICCLSMQHQSSPCPTIPSFFSFSQFFFDTSFFLSFDPLAFHSPPFSSSLSWICLIDVTTALQKQVKQKLQSEITLGLYTEKWLLCKTDIAAADCLLLVKKREDL